MSHIPDNLRSAIRSSISGNDTMNPNRLDIQELPPAYRKNASSLSDPPPNAHRSPTAEPYGRSAQITDRYTSIPITRRITRVMEEGGGTIQSSDSSDTRDEIPQRRPGILTSLLQLYTSPSHEGSSNHPKYPESALSSRSTSLDTMEMQRTSTMGRTSSGLSTTSLVDPDDPRVNGGTKNRVDDDNWLARRPWEHEKAYWDLDTDEKTREMEKERAIIEHQILSRVDRQHFILKLAKALMFFGAPSHRLESQLVATARVLSLSAQFIHFPGLLLVTFTDTVSKTSETHVVTATTRLQLGRLHEVHKIYRSVVHAEIGVAEGTQRLRELLRSPPIYPVAARCCIAFCCASVICPLAFGGSVMDALVAGSAGAFLAFLQLHAARQSVMFANIFEITIAMLVAFVARGLSSWQPEWFCYSAISTAGVVLILPGFAVLCSALELASKNIVSGSTRLVWAISYTLFLGFSLTSGSDLYFLMDKGARERRVLAATSLTNIVQMNGTIIPDTNSSSIYQSVVDMIGEELTGTWVFTNQTRKSSFQYKYQIVGCYREPAWPWYRQPFPFWSLFILVPLYSLCSSSWNLQPLWSKQMPVMMAISCLSYAARKVLQHFIGPRNEIVSAVGAFVIGILGNMYARVFRATAFTTMVTAVLFLVPSGIAAAGGLAMNYRGSDGDQYTSSISIGIKMLQVAIGTTVGLLASGLVVYSFGTRKKSALFAF